MPIPKKQPAGSHEYGCDWQFCVGHICVGGCGCFTGVQSPMHEAGHVHEQSVGITVAKQPTVKAAGFTSSYEVLWISRSKSSKRFDMMITTPLCLYWNLLRPISGKDYLVIKY